MWCVKQRIKLNLEKNQGDYILNVHTRQETELNLKLYGKTLKICPQVKLPGITFDSKVNFKKHFEDILDRLQYQVSPFKTIGQQKVGT